MLYPEIAANLKQVSLPDLQRAASQLRTYKNVTILTIPHWSVIPELKDAAKQAGKDQRRVMREIKSRPEFHKVVLPARVSAQLQATQSQPEKINTGDRVHSTYHDADGVVIRLEWSPRVGSIYHVRLDNGQVVCVAREDLIRIEESTAERC